ncbi:asparagine synthase (glutamine-hydrolyzing) [Phycicoccus sp. BSK3Z-2]|uniref:asparagine synthase (glutamine-hydrolyzing) n=1 Tax=Phycicoccus avicenniae TaxID=2828860 RepID=A0A941I0N5_9MICO|nr:asparagine synthase (glutamine-hydrolyzing) [Phycicoccus avicenniae]MBR7743406.1 asparagine synthase (glutamine-hydrolyzing) [Phycicoccus avicenniae]
MCGIAVVHDARPEAAAPDAAATGAVMLDALTHRGPDGRGERQVGATWLGHTRLAIVDLDGGAQPMTSDDGWWVVANGEVYNHEELRADLAGDGRRLRTASDSEVLLHVVAAWGTAGVARLRGMVAGCVVGPAGDVVLVRDPLGIKPLYWARRGGRMLAASELRAFPPEWRPAVEEFPAGHTWTPAEGLRPTTDLHDDPAGSGGVRPPFRTREAAVAAVREAVVDAVRERMMADVPLGVFLSGGLDSSIVAAVMAREAAPGTVVRSFSAGTADSPDLAAARRVAAHLGLEHHERVYGGDDVLDVLPEVVRSLESAEPSLVRSAVPNYLLSALAAEHVKVVLTGEGADELFAGYHHLRGLPADELAAALVTGVDVLHHLNLQRADRVSMAHGLEARVPFLALEVLDVARRVPVEWKLLGEDGHEQAQEKALLREAFAGWLPDDVLWRRKEQFGDGSGTAAVMAQRAEAFVPEGYWADERVEGLPAARTREELGYQRILAAHLGGVRADRVLGTWPET